MAVKLKLAVDCNIYQKNPDCFYSRNEPFYRDELGPAWPIEDYKFATGEERAVLKKTKNPQQQTCAKKPHNETPDHVQTVQRQIHTVKLLLKHHNSAVSRTPETETSVYPAAKSHGGHCIKILHQTGWRCPFLLQISIFAKYQNQNKTKIAASFPPFSDLKA